MSYEGLEQALCAVGHYQCYDCYSPIPKKCQIKGCDEKIVWRNSVDQTNGSHSGKKRIDGYVELKPNPVKTCKCDRCGHEHTIGAKTYKIPKNKGHKV